MTRAEKIEESAKALVASWDDPSPSWPFVEALARVLARIASLCDGGVVTLGQIEHIARAALATSAGAPGKGEEP